MVEFIYRDHIAWHTYRLDFVAFWDYMYRVIMDRVNRDV